MAQHPWWHFGMHLWIYSTDEETRRAMRAANKDVWIMGTFEAREVRTCKHCGRVEFRDVYGGNFRPHDWTLREIKPLPSPPEEETR